jgi:hypothetical protein
VDNIIATKSWSDPNHISHMSLISKDNAAEPEYYPIMSISGTTVVIGGIAERVRGASVPQPRPYRGTTETVPTYFRTPTRYNWTTAQSAIVTGGTVGNRVVVSGGWSRTDMSTQTDITVFSAVGAYSQVFSVGPGISSVEVSSFAYAHFNNGNLFQTSFLASGDFKHHVSFVAGCWNTPFIRTDTSPANGQLYDLRISRGWTFNSGALVLDNANIWKVNGMQTPLKAYFRRLHGRSEGSAITLPNGSRELINMRIDMIDNNSAFALTDSTTYYLQNCYLRNCVMQNNAQGDFAPGLVQLNLFLERCTFQGPVISGNPNTGLGSPFNNGGWAGKILVNAFGGVTWDNREYSMWYRWVSDNANRHIPAGPPSQGASWKVSLYNSTLFTADFPARKSLVKVACKANEARTVSVWLMRDDPGLTLGLMTLSSYVAGVTRQQVPMTAGASTWQQVSISFTPTEDGLVDIWGYAFGGTTFNGWFSDVSVT